MTTEENKALVRRYFAEVVSGGNLALIDELFAPAVTVNGQPGGPDVIGQIVGNYRAAFPDLEAIVEEQVAEGDRVSTRRLFRGTHLGDYNSPIGRVPATGRRAEWRIISIVRIEDGRIMEDWAVPDILGQLQQLGAVPGPPAT
jgi:predicted ester cyclase